MVDSNYTISQALKQQKTYTYNFECSWALAFVLGKTLRPAAEFGILSTFVAFVASSLNVTGNLEKLVQLPNTIMLMINGNDWVCCLYAIWRLINKWYDIDELHFGYVTYCPIIMPTIYEYNLFCISRKMMISSSNENMHDRA